MTITTTLNQPAPNGGLELRLYAGAGSTAMKDDDFILPRTLTVAAGERSGTELVSIVDDALDESDETAVIGVGRPLNAYPTNTEHSIMSYADDTNHCRPQAYDILAMMANCQSR